VVGLTHATGTSAASSPNFRATAPRSNTVFAHSTTSTNAKAVAQHLDSPHYVWEFRRAIRCSRGASFVDHHRAGRTPIAFTNLQIKKPTWKFEPLLRIAQAIGAERLANRPTLRPNSQNHQTGRLGSQCVPSYASKDQFVFSLGPLAGTAFRAATSLSRRTSPGLKSAPWPAVRNFTSSEAEGMELCLCRRETKRAIIQA